MAKQPQWSDIEKVILYMYYPEAGAKYTQEKLKEFGYVRPLSSIQRLACKWGIKCDVTKQRIHLGLKKLDLPKNIMLGPSGYLVIYEDGTIATRKLYHRYIMEQHLGRALLEDELVHHIDDNKLNNHISNLQLTNRSEHCIMHHHTNNKI